MLYIERELALTNSCTKRLKGFHRWTVHMFSGYHGSLKAEELTSLAIRNYNISQLLTMECLKMSPNRPAPVRPSTLVYSTATRVVTATTNY